MAEISRRQLFAMGAAAAVAPVLPAVASPMALHLHGSTTIWLSNNFSVPVRLRKGDRITFSGDGRTFYVTGASSGQ